MKITVVTGANRGIGFEIARQLAEAGHQIIFAARDRDRSEEAFLQIREYQPSSMFIELDLGDPTGIEAFAKRLGNEVSHIDVLVNNGAILEDEGTSIRTINEELFARMFEVNFWGAFRLTRALLPLLDKSEDPRIINMSSGMGELTNLAGGYPAYRLSKTAINGLTVRVASDEPHIKVNSVSPGWVRTDMGGPAASRTVQKGAETPVWLATADDIPTGKLLRDKQVIDW